MKDEKKDIFTGGDGKGVSPVLFSLPNTGLLIRFSGLAAESPDGELNAIGGTKPDIWAGTSNESAYETDFTITSEKR